MPDRNGCVCGRSDNSLEVYMNARQAARKAAKKIEELEYIVSAQSRDIKEYNEVIQHMMKHGSPCDWCEDQQECREAGKDLTIGCEEWMLRFWKPEEEASNDSEGILPEGT